MRRSLALLLVAALLAAGCSGGGDPVPDPSGEAEVADPAPVASQFASCDPLTDPPPQAPAQAPAPAGDPLPPLDLTCFTGNAPFPLAALRGPAVVNLWASWCTPCRAELPVLQQLADQTAGELHVLGVVTGDTQRKAAYFAEDLGLRFPALHDPQMRLLSGLEQVGLAALPVTVFVDRNGQISHVHQGPPFDEPELAGLVAEHLRVELPSG